MLTILPQLVTRIWIYHETMREYVDADHAGYATTRRSLTYCTGFMIYLNSAPIH